MGGRKRVRAAAEAEPEVEVGAELSAEVSAEVGAGTEAEAPAWVQAKAPPKAPTRASTTKTPVKLRSRKRKKRNKKRIRAPHVMPSPAEALKALTEELTVTVDDAAVLLKLSRHYAYAMVKKGNIPSIRIGKRVIRVPSVALRTMLQLETREAAE